MNILLRNVLPIRPNGSMCTLLRYASFHRDIFFIFLDKGNNDQDKNLTKKLYVLIMNLVCYQRILPSLFFPHHSLDPPSSSSTPLSFTHIKSFTKLKKVTPFNKLANSSLRRDFPRPPEIRAPWAPRLERLRRPFCADFGGGERKRKKKFGRPF